VLRGCDSHHHQTRKKKQQQEKAADRGSRESNSRQGERTTMLPTTTSKGRGAARSAPPLFGPYLRRIVKVGVGLPFVPLSSESASFDRISWICLWRCSGVRVSKVAVAPQLL
jgi:hypothetical protein